MLFDFNINLKIPSNFLIIINHPWYKGYDAFFIHNINGTTNSYVRIEATEQIIIMNIKDIVFIMNNEKTKLLKYDEKFNLIEIKLK